MGRDEVAEREALVREADGARTELFGRNDGRAP